MTFATRFNYKHLTIFLLLLIAGMSVQAQKIADFKVKNSTNTVERTAMLDLLRAKMKAEEGGLDYKYVVNHFKVSGNFAWLMATAQRKDNKPLVLEDYQDCCHVECLFKRSTANGRSVNTAPSAQTYGTKAFRNVPAPLLGYLSDFGSF